MKHPVANLFLFATIVLMWACPAPSVGPSPATPAVPEESSSSSSATTIKEVDPPPDSGADAPPTWTPSSAGSIDCGAGSLFAKISLEDRSPVHSEFLEFVVTAKESGDYGPLEAHALRIDRIRITDPAAPPPSALSLNPDAGGLLNPILLPSGVSPPPKKASRPAGPLELNAWIDLQSTVEAPRTIVGGDSNPSADFCETIAAAVAQKRFQVQITYRSGDRLYEKTKGDLPVILAGVSGGPIEDYVFVLELKD